MASILETLAIELALDPAKFKEGLKQALEASKKGHEQIVKNATQIEEHTKRSTDAVGKLSREFQAFFGVIGGALGVNALKSLVEHMAMADAAVGRLAANLGTTPQKLSAWGYAAERLGGNAQTAEASIASLRSRVFRLSEFGENPGTNFWRGLARGGVTSDEFLSTKDPYTQMMKIATAIQNIARTDRAKAYSYGKEAFGLDEGSVNVILQGGDKMKAMLASIAHIVPTDKDVLNAQKMQEAWAGLTQQMEALARLSYEPITKFLEKLTAFVKVLSGETTAVEANREVSDNPDSYVSPHAFARYYNRLAKKNHYLHRMWDGTFGNSWLGRGLGYGSNPDYSPSAGGASAANPESATAGAGSGSGTASVTGLSQQRFRDELTNTELYEKIMRVSANEQGSDEAANLKVIESLRNRAAMMGTSLAQEARFTAEGGYYAGRDRGGLVTARNRAMIERNMRRAFEENSNTANYATDNASQAWGWNRMHGMYGLDATGNGEYFGHPVRSDARGWNRYQAWRDRVSQQKPYSAIGVDWSQYGARFAPSTSSTSSYSQSTSSMFLNGPITIETRATDAQGFARDLRPAIEAQTNTFMANGAAH